jgi:virulence-associated protein VagC
VASSSSSEERAGEPVAPATENSRIGAPLSEGWAAWFDDPAVRADFMTDRAQATDQLRKMPW